MKVAQKLAVNYLRARLNLLAVLSPRKAAEQAFTIFCTPFYRNKKKAAPIFDDAEKITLQVKGNTVRGYRWNAGGSRRVLVLHGFESSVKNFDAYIIALIKKGYEVLAFDAPAHGDSGGRQITLPLYVDTIAAIHFQVGIIQSFMAHSFGGLALAHFIEKIPNAGCRVAFIAPATESRSAIDSFFRFLQLNHKVRSAFEKIIADKSGVPAEYFSIPRALENIAAEVLWVHDKDDEVTPFKDVAPVMEKQLPNLHFLITEGLGHKKIYRDALVIKKVVEFL
ncbi:MAG TPA: alpha/beta hydrolase [Chitinophagaceae bacterium]|nr:alpha/beta hydrolase [Chitinophagaceae bacterium]